MSSTYRSEMPCVSEGFLDHSTSCHTADTVLSWNVIHHVRLSCASSNYLQNKYECLTIPFFLSLLFVATKINPCSLYLYSSYLCKPTCSHSEDSCKLFLRVRVASCESKEKQDICRYSTGVDFSSGGYSIMYVERGFDC